MSAIAELLKKRVILDREIPDVGPVRVRRMTAGDIHDLAGMKDNRAATAWTIRTCVVDEDGNPVYASDEEVWGTDQQILKALYDAVAEVNQLRVEEAKKESSAPPSSP